MAAARRTKGARNTAGPLRRRADGITLAVHLQPRASDSRLLGVEAADDGTFRLRARVIAAPAEGQANRALVKLIAKALDIAPSRVTIERGAASRHKLIAIEGDPAMLELKLKPWLESRE